MYDFNLPPEDYNRYLFRCINLQFRYFLAALRKILQTIWLTFCIAEADVTAKISHIETTCAEIKHSVLLKQ